MPSDLLDSFRDLKPLPNLNKDSTHPNPWAPPNRYERLNIFYDPYKIYKGHPTDFKPLHNRLQDDPFLKKMGVAAFKGWVLGNAIALTDIMMVSRVKTFRSGLARYFFIMPAYMAMPMSYVATRDAMATVVGDKPWIYYASGVVPASIFGIFRNSFAAGLKGFVFLAWIPLVYKFHCDSGGVFTFNKVALPESNYQTTLPHLWKTFSTWSVTDTFASEPSWKKWVDSEKTGPGPSH